MCLRVPTWWCIQSTARFCYHHRFMSWKLRQIYSSNIANISVKFPFQIRNLLTSLPTCSADLIWCQAVHRLLDASSPSVIVRQLFLFSNQLGFSGFSDLFWQTYPCTALVVIFWSTSISDIRPCKYVWIQICIHMYMVVMIFTTGNCHQACLQSWLSGFSKTLHWENGDN